MTKPREWNPREARDECLIGIMGDADRYVGDKHGDVAARVFRRLQLRQAQLKALEELTRLHLVHKELVKKSPRTEPVPTRENEGTEDTVFHSVREAALADSFAGMRAYHLAVTDLFVEKAIVYLEKEANLYRVWGIIVNGAALAVLVIGVWVAVSQLLTNAGLPTGETWPTLISSFIRNFTAYGMLVILAVGIRRFGRAMLDQGERLFERRHAMRQGRLFVHLNDGILSVDELERAFNWNAVGSNAFGSMQTEDQAPFGAAFREFMRQAPELLRVSLQQAAKGVAAAEDKQRT